MTAALTRGAYAALLRLATPLYLARLWWRGRREPLYRSHLGQRLGLASAGTPTGRVWIHAVSLGETLAAAALIEALREQSPGLRLLLTHSTATGREAGVALLRDGDTQAWLPYDTPGAVRRFLHAHQPRIGVLMETETWPVLLHEARVMGLPMVLANARLSERSLGKGRSLASLLRPALASFAAVLAQTDLDAVRFREIGALTTKVMGNVKFDLTPDAALLALGRRWRKTVARAVVLAAVTREGEEQPLLATWCELPKPRPLLVIVPRHPQRFDEVAALVLAAGLALQRRSMLGDAISPEVATADVWLGDSMREMSLYYGVAHAALLGGSFAPLGGQNLIEAAACACPLVMGPHTFNFALAAELAIEAGAAVRAADMAQAVPRAAGLALAPDREAWALRAERFASAHRGAAARMAAEVLRLAAVNPS